MDGEAKSAVPALNGSSLQPITVSYSSQRGFKTCGVHMNGRVFKRIYTKKFIHICLDLHYFIVTMTGATSGKLENMKQL
jgi:hypothetical protein